MKPTALLSVLLLSSSCSGVYESREIDPEVQLELYVTTATYLYEDESYVRAQEQAVKALEIDPEHAVMRRMIGWIRLKYGSSEDLVIAERFFRDLADEGDNSQAAVIGLATTLERLAVRFDRASKEFASGARPTPDGSPAEDKARELAKRSRRLLNESIDLYESTLVQGEGSVLAVQGLQRVTALLGRYEDSLAWSERLIDSSRAELADWQRMLRTENLTVADDEFLRANERETLRLQLETYLLAADLYQILDRVEEGLDCLDAAVLLNPTRATTYSYRAQLRLRHGDFQLAIEDLDNFLKLSGLAYEHPDIKKAFDLRTTCEQELEKLTR